MSTFEQTQISQSPEASRAGFEVSDVMNLDATVDVVGEPYVAGDRFHVCDNIGGNISVVYNAIDLEAESLSIVPDSIVKVLLHNDDEFPNREALGAIEITVMESLPAHPNIIRYLGQGSIAAANEEDYRFIAMERVNFGTLAKPRGRLSGEELEKAFQDVAYSLGHLEEFSLVHGDIKPDNIGLHREKDGTIVAKIFDFGAARPINDDPSAFKVSHSEQFDVAVQELHQKGILARTPNFASPEVVSKQRITPAADVYSLGCSVASILHLENYINNNLEDEDATEARESGRRIGPPDLRVLPDSVPPHIGVLLSQCLEREPEDRITTSCIPELLAA